MQSTLNPVEVVEPPFHLLSEDVTQVLIQLLSVRGHGKSSSLRTILKRIKQKRTDIVFKIFDVSQAWFHNAPVAHRQLVTWSRLRAKQIMNVEDCVYEMGQLTDLQRRAFVGSIIAQDYKERYNLKLANAGKLEVLPWVIYVFEEANVYFGSYSFRKNDEISPILQDFVSVGRNYRLSGFLVATAEVGEISPSLRRRSSRLYGQVESESDLGRLRRKDKGAMALVKSLPKYHFLYYGRVPIGPFRIRDEVKEAPEDYIVIEEEPVKKPYQLSYWEQIFVGLGLGALVAWIIYHI